MDNVKLLNIKVLKKKYKKEDESCTLMSHEDVMKDFKKRERERNRRYRSWLGWFWKAHDWCYYSYWAVRRWTPFKELKWFFQRGCRGWSDCDAWGATNHIARVISEMTAYLAKDPTGTPNGLQSIQEWKHILRKLSRAFDIMDKKERYRADLWKKDPALARQCDMQTLQESIKVEEGWYILRKWFYALWD